MLNIVLNKKRLVDIMFENVPVFLVYFLVLEILNLKKTGLYMYNRNHVFLSFQISHKLQKGFEIAGQFFSVKYIFLT